MVKKIKKSKNLIFNTEYFFLLFLDALGNILSKKIGVIPKQFFFVFDPLLAHRAKCRTKRTNLLATLGSYEVWIG